MPSGVVSGAEWDEAPEVLRRDSGLLGNILKHNSGLPICGSQQTDGILDSQMGFSEFVSFFSLCKTLRRFLSIVAVPSVTVSL